MSETLLSLPSSFPLCFSLKLLPKGGPLVGNGQDLMLCLRSGGFANNSGLPASCFANKEGSEMDGAG